jgi:5-methylcytosine-specific restriction endonuclease McrA
MACTIQNSELVELIFAPDITTGFSQWKTREEINETGLKLGTNGNIRHGTPWSVKYIWEIERLNNKPRGKPLRFRTIGFSEEIVKSRPIRSDIRKELLKNNKTCCHCGSRSDLCIDHKNDMYNNSRVLNENTQILDDFQVLCNRCNKDYKHQANEKEKKTGLLHSVKHLRLTPYSNDKFIYPWEVAIKKYDENDINCKIYTYWYDVDAYKSRYVWFLNLRFVNYQILRLFK